MSRDVERSTTSKPRRPSRHEHIPLNPMATLVHSNPTSHGASEAGDDTRSDLSTSESVASSPFQHARSVLSMVNELPKNLDALREIVPERKYVSTSEQQTAVACTKDLSVPMNFFPGETNVKVKEDVTYRSQDRKTTDRGELLVTDFCLLFVTKPPDAAREILVDIPLATISQIEKIGGQTRSNISERSDYGIEITSKDSRQFFFGTAKENHQRRNLFDSLNRLIFPFADSKADISNPEQFFSSFFAFHHKRAACPNGIDEGWSLYNKVKDFTRMGIQRHSDAHWTINTKINQNYTLCDTYPDVLVVPANFDENRLTNVAAFRSRNRLPVLSWYNRKTYVTITRASQPLTGLNHKSRDDVDYLNAIASTNVDPGSRLFILDARPKFNAIANKAHGGGYEDYSECDLEFHNIQNIHVMRESLTKLYSTIRASPHDDKVVLNDSENANWLSHIQCILTAVNRLVSLVHNDRRSVLVHCSDGWDRTAQLTSLSMLMLDRYYRTLDGYMILIEKEWISFGHKFSTRIGHGAKGDSERSPVFLQFLDCTYQLLQQFDSEFEFNEKLLLTIAEHLYSCKYGTFLLDSDKFRKEMNISEYTMSVWTPIMRERKLYTNPRYKKQSDTVLVIDVTSTPLKFWTQYHHRHLLNARST